MRGQTIKTEDSSMDVTTNSNQTFICSFNDFIEKAEELCPRKEKWIEWVFRGHGSLDWELETSIERLCNRIHGNLTYTKELEIELLREFQRRYHFYSTNIPRESDLLQWLSIMRHNGAPTRLLDFTYSIYIAAYFAVEEYVAMKSSKGSDIYGFDIWAINSTVLGETVRLNSKRLAPKKSIEDNVNSDNVVNKFLFEHNRRRGVIQVTPFRFNEKQSFQKGIFICPIDITTSFKDNLFANGSNEKDYVKRLTFDEKKWEGSCRGSPKNGRDMGWEFLERLDDMNISRKSLFPGLQGFAESLSKYHHSYWKITTKNLNKSRR